MAADYDGEDEQVEFLDLGTGGGPDGDGADEVDWLEEADGEERVAAGRDPRRLPPRATRNRALASVLSLAVVLSAAIGAGTAAYDRHQTDVRSANLVRLAASSTAPSIPGLTELAFAPKWHAILSEQVVVPVVNKSPHPITLLDGRLTETGLRGAPTLKPVGKAVIPPEGTGELGGMVTADCTAGFSDMSSGANPQSSAGLDGTTTAMASVIDTASLDAGDLTKMRESMGALQVQARSVSGHLGEQTIFPEQAVGNTADRICSQQGRKVAQLNKVTTSVDPSAHTFTVSVTAKSLADTALEYVSSAGFETLPGALGLELAGDFSPSSQDDLVQPGGSFTVSFQMTVVTCPTSATFHQDQIMLNVTFLSDDFMLSGVNESVAARPLIYGACGLPADWQG
ncbi:hypothetical protein [Actinospica robiniae]|uniref:hypothetical protein n=1 Tax=Actinospica robiniae TaxID=304901 RepID=UPI0003F5A988|nr:hypothetical protein [Actinospica robiniae]